MLTVKKTINEYLDATERKYGASVRKQTSVEHRGGIQIVLKRPDRHAQTVDVGSLRLMTEQLLKAA
ncbi:MAG: hypothetical protein BMS9Abin18_1094 [Zetaproteobacteria bacterium]|nr:MAG: hypothetical protein BMS9Abin18_1094 [Zetaproteobacteria bacterium]